jgi:hypothetical protein
MLLETHKLYNVNTANPLSSGLIWWDSSCGLSDNLDYWSKSSPKRQKKNETNKCKFKNIGNADENKSENITVEPLFKIYKRQYMYLSIEVSGLVFF